METKNPTFEDDLAELLGDLSTIQDELLAVLAEKRDRMAEGNAAGMAALQSREEELGSRLKACHDRRSELLSVAEQRGLPSDSISELTSALENGKPGKLQRQAKETSTRMRLLQHQSLTNWVLAQRSLLHISQLLEIIATGGQIQPTYGKEKSLHARGALVDHDA